MWATIRKLAELVRYSRRWCAHAVILGLCHGLGVHTDAAQPPGQVEVVPPPFELEVAAPGQTFDCQVWQTEQGLPGNTVNCLLRTLDGFLWVGTEAGLARFDGATFMTIELPGSLNSVSNRITALGEDEQRNLWVGTGKGVCVLGAESLWYTDANGLPDSEVTCLAIEPSGVAWVGTAKGLARIEDGVVETFSVDQGLPSNHVQRLHLSRQGKLWATTAGGVCEWQGRGFEPFTLAEEPVGEPAATLGIYEDQSEHLWLYGETYLLDLSRRQRLNFFPLARAEPLHVWSVCEDGLPDDPRLWIGTSGQGLLCYRSEQFTPVPLQAGAELVYEVRIILRDNEANLWLGTGGTGLIRLRGRLVQLSNESAGLPAEPAATVARGNDGALWLGFATSGLWSRAGGRTERWEDPTLAGGPQSVRSISVDTWGWWAGTAGEGLLRWRNGRLNQLTLADGLADEFVTAVQEDRKGGVWMGTASGLLQHWDGQRFQTYTKGNRLSGQPVTALLVAADDTVWVGSDGGGLRRLRKGQKRLDQFLGRPTLTNAVVTSLFEDRSKRVWVGTLGQGLFVRLPQRWKQLTTRNGLPENDILAVLPEPNGGLLVVGSRTCFQISRTAIRRFAENRGPPRPRVVTDMGDLMDPGLAGWPRASLDDLGRLWVATRKGLAIVDLRRLERAQGPPPVYIEDVRIEGRTPSAFAVPYLGRHASRAEPQSLKVQPGFGRLDIDYTAPSLADPARVLFRHRLEGFDDDWVEAGTARSARYGRLPPGHYVFQVRACNNEGVWNNEGASLQIFVPRPYWAQAWFLVPVAFSSTLVLVGTGRFVFNRRLRRRLKQAEQESAMERERARIARDMHDEIGSKLTRITILSKLARDNGRTPDRRQEQLVAIADASDQLVRKLDEIVWAVNPKNDTVQHLADYLGQYAVEYFENTQVECTVKISPTLPDSRLSAEARHNLFLGFEEALSNALGHGKPKHVGVTMEASNGDLEIRVTDNGTGFDLDAKKREGADGLGNMRQRLTAVGGRCDISSGVGQGTTVRMMIQIKQNGRRRYG